MTPGNSNPNVELKRLIRLLESTSAMVQEASLTGAMRDGARAALRTYNNVRTHLVERGEIPEFLFPPLPDDSTLGDVGISCGQLAEYLSGGLPESEEKEEGAGKGLFIGNLNLGSGGDRDELEELVREKIAEFLGQGKKESGSSSGETVDQTTVSMSASGSREPRAVARLSLPTGARVEEVLEEKREGEAAR